MIKAQHTPGLWLFNGLTITGNNDVGCIIAAVTSKIYDERSEIQEAKANARLIAAAPELLEACKIAIDLLRRLPVPSPKDITGESYWDQRNTIEQAIAKAEGNQ